VANVVVRVESGEPAVLARLQGAIQALDLG
jgi:hypothetical protein